MTFIVRLPFPLRVLALLLAVLMLACTVCVPVAQAEGLTAGLALFGGAALVSGVLAAAGLKASGSSTSAWSSWCENIASSSAVRTVAQALWSGGTLPLGKLVAYIAAGKSYVAKELQKAIINQAIQSGAYSVSDGFTMDVKALDGYLTFPASSYDIHFYKSVELHSSSTTVIFPALEDVTYVVCKNIRNNVETSDNIVCILSKSVTSLSYIKDGFSTTKRLSSWNYNGGKFWMSALAFYSTTTSSAISHIAYDGVPRACNTYIGDLGTLLYRGKEVASSGVEGVEIQPDAIPADPIGKDVIGDLSDLADKIAGWQDYLDKSVDVAIDGAAEEPVPALPVTIPAQGAQGTQGYEDARTGDTTADVIDSGESTASKEASQSAISGVISDMLGYLKPDVSFFDKFPLCIPYDIYLAVGALTGTDVSDKSIFQAQAGQLDADISTQAQSADTWEPVIAIKKDITVAGILLPIDLEIDLTPYADLWQLIRVSSGVLYIVSMLLTEWQRIREE